MRDALRLAAAALVASTWLLVATLVPASAQGLDLYDPCSLMIPGFVNAIGNTPEMSPAQRFEFLRDEAARIRAILEKAPPDKPPDLVDDLADEI